MILSEEQFRAAVPDLPKNADVFLPYLNRFASQYEVNTPERWAHFLSQVGHESGGFRYVRENLNYSAAGLLATFGKYFDDFTAKQYARNPQRIANRVYANRMGNGPESSGEGWKYRGRALLQITGKEQYMKLSKEIFGDTRLLDTPELLEVAEYAVQSAFLYWNRNKLNLLADNAVAAVPTITKVINGGNNGLADRRMRYNHAINELT